MFVTILRVRYRLLIVATALILAFVSVFLDVGSSFATQPRNFQVMRAARPQPPHDAIIGCPPRTCGPQRLANGSALLSSPLTIRDPQTVSNSRFVTVQGASSNADDIVQLVDDAVSVWEKAFEPASFPNITIHVGWADFGIGGLSDQNGSLAPDPDYPESFMVPSDAIGLHICGAPISSNQSPDPYVDSSGNGCRPAALDEVTVLFNSEPLSFDYSGQQGDIKLLLDSNPFNALIWDNLQTIPLKGSRLELTPDVVDLFTVALHEVGHVLGFSEINPAVEDLINQGPLFDAAHIPAEKPSVMAEYLAMNTRKCPTPDDVELIHAFGSYVPEASGYAPSSLTPCQESPARYVP